MFLYVFIKGTVSVILSDPQCKVALINIEENTVVFKALKFISLYFPTAEMRKSHL